MRPRAGTLSDSRTLLLYERRWTVQQLAEREGCGADAIYKRLERARKLRREQKPKKPARVRTAAGGRPMLRLPDEAYREVMATLARTKAASLRLK